MAMFQIFRAFGTVGAIAVADIDDDGFQEVFVPAYSTSQIIVMSYKPWHRMSNLDLLDLRHLKQLSLPPCLYIRLPVHF